MSREEFSLVVHELTKLVKMMEASFLIAVLYITASVGTITQTAYLPCVLVGYHHHTLLR